ncbi:MAG: 2-hydroxychromene-2-carboxylate isomerase [Xanthobacteraceae bacterium]|nr:MAG: 2-hydroxychromene-2-carboxylate isomerase [Xanthobacteraceae bacterium]
MTAPRLDFWYDFSSTYSYLASARIEEIADDAGVAVRWRPFLLGPVFKAQGMETSPFNLFPVKGAYMWRDVARQAADLGIPFRQPTQFPQNSVLPARIAMLGFQDGWGEKFTHAVYHAAFADDRPMADAGVMRDVLSGLGLNADEVLARAQSDEAKAALRQQTEEAQGLGIFGAPTFTTSGGELFWGNDRLPQAIRWAQRHAAA